jgi:hypothetical protein
MHGSLGAGAGWAPPRMVAYADVEARLAAGRAFLLLTAALLCVGRPS